MGGLILTFRYFDLNVEYSYIGCKLFFSNKLPLRDDQAGGLTSKGGGKATWP